MIVYYNHDEIVKMLDSTLLRPDIIDADLTALCEDAKRFGFPAVIVNPCNVKYCRKLLKDSDVKVGTVIGFPLGETLKTKLTQIKQAKKDGAQDLDIMISLSALKNGRWDLLAREMKKLMAACKGKTVKVIIETCYLTREEIIKACELCVSLKVRFVKTSTGYGTAGATLENVELMLQAIKDAPRDYDKDLFPCQIKASGGIKTYLDAKLLAEAGAFRIGTSHAREIALSDEIPAEKTEPVAEKSTPKAIPLTKREFAKPVAEEIPDAAEEEPAVIKEPIIAEVIVEEEPIVAEEEKIDEPVIAVEEEAEEPVTAEEPVVMEE